MQQALQNPHYKKIWEKVIMNKHPEEVCLQDALGRELQMQHCEYIAFGNLYVQDKNFSLPHAYNKCVTEILGIPIALFDVLILLNKNAKDYIFMADGLVIHSVNNGNYNDIQKVCDFNTNLLYEQTPKTWEKIANLID